MTARSTSSSTPHDPSRVGASPAPGAQAPAPAAAALLDLARLLARAWADEPGPPQLVGVTPTAGDPAAPGELAFADLPTDDPVGALLGLEAPRSWGALGVAATARVRPLDRAAPTASIPAGPCTFVHLVAVDGSSASVLARPDQPPVVLDPSVGGGGGRVDDLCRRALRLPTAPPPCGLGAHLVDLWLERLVAATSADPGLGWTDAAALHPLHGLARSTRPADLAAVTAAAAGVPEWEEYRRAVAGGRGPAVGSFGAAEAAWLDAGSFARAVLGEALPWRTAVEHLAAVLSPATSALVAATVRLSPAGPGGPRCYGEPSTSTGGGPGDAPMGP